MSRGAGLVGARLGRKEIVRRSIMDVKEGLGREDRIEWTGITALLREVSGIVLSQREARCDRRLVIVAALAVNRLDAMMDGLMIGDVAVIVMAAWLIVVPDVPLLAVRAATRGLHHVAMIAARATGGLTGLVETIVRLSLPIAGQADIVPKGLRGLLDLLGSMVIVVPTARRRSSLIVDSGRGATGTVLGGHLLARLIVALPVVRHSGLGLVEASRTEALQCRLDSARCRLVGWDRIVMGCQTSVEDLCPEEGHRSDDRHSE